MKLGKKRFENPEKLKDQKQKFHKKEPVVSTWAKRLAIAGLLGTAALFSKNAGAEEKKDKTELTALKDAHQGIVPIKELTSSKDLSKGLVILQIGADWCTACEVNKEELTILYNLAQGYLNVYHLDDVESKLAGTIATQHNFSLYDIPLTLYFKDGKLVKKINSAQPLEVHIDECKNSFGIYFNSIEVNEYLETQLNTDNEKVFAMILSRINRRNSEVDLSLLEDHFDSKNLSVRYEILQYILNNCEQISELEKEEFEKFVSFSIDSIFLSDLEMDYENYEEFMLVHFTAPSALACLGEPVVDYLAKLLDDKDFSVRQQAVSVLYLLQTASNLGSIVSINIFSFDSLPNHLLLDEEENTFYKEKLISAFKKALDDSNPIIRSAAAYNLGFFDSKYHKLIVPSLMKALKDKDKPVREMAVASLVDFINVNDTAKKTILKLIKNGDHQTREIIASRFMCNSESPDLDLSLLEKLIEDKNWKVRMAAAESLGWYKIPASLTLLAKTIEDENYEVRLQAVESIGNIYDDLVPLYKKQAKFYMIKAANDENKEVSEAAKEILKDYMDDDIDVNDYI